MLCPFSTLLIFGSILCDTSTIRSLWIKLFIDEKQLVWTTLLQFLEQILFFKLRIFSLYFIWFVVAYLKICCSVTQSWLTLCNPTDCSRPGFLVFHYLPEFAQTYVHWVDDATQSSNPLLLPSPALNLSQYQCLFQWVGSSHQVAKVLPLQLQYQSSQWIFKGWFPLGVTGLISLLSNGLSRVFYTTVLGPHLKNGLSLEKTSYVSSMKQE